MKEDSLVVCMEEGEEAPEGAGAEASWTPVDVISHGLALADTAARCLALVDVAARRRKAEKRGRERELR